MFENRVFKVITRALRSPQELEILGDPDGRRVGSIATKQRAPHRKDEGL